MQDFNIVRRNEPENTFRVESIKGKFDLQTNVIQETFKGCLKIPEKWQIGLIVGASGTGKTTIARELFPDSYVTDFQYSSDAVVNDLPEAASIEQITKMFNSVGFSSPPSWLKPYAVLSNGEKMRVDLANALLNENDLIVFDEFTSVVDRNVAKIGSFAVQKAIRKTDKRFIAVGCHYDVEEWLMPDWVFNTDSMTFTEKKKTDDPDYNLKSTVHSLSAKGVYGKCLQSIII